MLKFLGKFLRGKATKIGAGLIAGGSVGTVVSASLVDELKAATELVSALGVLVGTIVTAFGVGRKAAAAADAPPSA